MLVRLIMCCIIVFAKQLPENEPIPQNVMQKINKGDAGEEDVDIGEDIPNSDIPLVVIEKDVSGKSSSSTSSSSSDSSSSGNRLNPSNLISYCTNLNTCI